MGKKIGIRSTSFDTSFLLKETLNVDKILKKLKKDDIPCYVTSTVISELELLRVGDRINEKRYKIAMSRWKRVNSKVIDFKNKIVSSELKKECVISMEEHHGVKPEDIINDCSILIVSLKNGIDLFLSEDFHFTSRVTEDVLSEIKSNACTEYSLMCGEEMYRLDTVTFLKAYDRGKIDLEIIEASQKNVKKPKKRIDKKDLY